HGADAARQVHRFVDVQGVWPAMADIAERAATRALVAHDHEGCRTLAETFTDVRTGGFLTDREHVVFTEDALDVMEARTRGGRLHTDPFRLLKPFSLDDLDGQPRSLVSRLLLGAGVIGGRTHGRFPRCGLLITCGHTLPGWVMVEAILTRQAESARIP